MMIALDNFKVFEAKLLLPFADRFHEFNQLREIKRTAIFQATDFII